jgi:hypothetical protein
MSEVIPADTNYYETYSDGTRYIQVPEATRGNATQLCTVGTGTMLHIRDDNQRLPTSLCGTFTYAFGGNPFTTSKMQLCKRCLKKLEKIS